MTERIGRFYRGSGRSRAGQVQAVYRIRFPGNATAAVRAAGLVAGDRGRRWTGIVRRYLFGPGVRGLMGLLPSDQPVENVL